MQIKDIQITKCTIILKIVPVFHENKILKQLFIIEIPSI